jgi:hypothetical protein
MIKKYIKIEQMKKIITALFCSILLWVAGNAQQQQQTPQLLKQPANWQFERFALPPEFAPSIQYKGAEELRFSPGMFAKDSTNYFTYAFVAELNNIQSISQDEIKNYLLEYFRGLCSSTAKSRKLSIDTSKITVDVERKKGTGSEVIYNVGANIFGVFADGAPVKLNMEVKALTNAAKSNVYLFFIASPHEKTDAVWKELYAIQREFKIP